LRIETRKDFHQIDLEGGPIGKGERYIHAKDVPLLNELQSDGWRPRISLLSPFDNLICDRTRTRLLFNFDFTVEIYTSSHKRKYGHYGMPILYGDKLIGRIDPPMDRKEGRLRTNAVHVEPKAPKGQRGLKCEKRRGRPAFRVSVQRRSSIQRRCPSLGAALFTSQKYQACETRTRCVFLS